MNEIAFIFEGNEKLGSLGGLLMWFLGGNYDQSTLCKIQSITGPPRKQKVIPINIIDFPHPRRIGRQYRQWRNATNGGGIPVVSIRMRRPKRVRQIQFKFISTSGNIILDLARSVIIRRVPRVAPVRFVINPAHTQLPLQLTADRWRDDETLWEKDRRKIKTPTHQFPHYSRRNSSLLCFEVCSSFHVHGHQPTPLKW